MSVQAFNLPSAAPLSVQTASPESVGMSSARLGRLEDHLKRNYIDTGRFPFTQTVIYRRGKLVHSAVQGLADVERKTPAKDDTILRRAVIYGCVMASFTVEDFGFTNLLRTTAKQAEERYQQFLKMTRF